MSDELPSTTRWKNLGAPEIISTPVGTVDGHVVFCTLQFESPIKKEFIKSLKTYLDYLEMTLNNPRKGTEHE